MYKLAKRLSRVRERILCILLERELLAEVGEGKTLTKAPNDWIDPQGILRN